MDSVTHLVLPIALGALMFAMGLSLTVADFRRVFVEGWAVVIGLGTLLLVVPIIGIVVAKLVPLDPLLSVGLFMVSTCPGGTFSNLLTHYGKGDLPLSISMTAIGSLLYVITAPFWVFLGLSLFVGSATTIHLSRLDALIELGRLIVVPVIAGMTARPWLPARIRSRVEQVLRDGAAVIIVGVFLFIFWQTRAILDPKALPAVLLLNACTVLTGWGAARAMRLTPAQQTSIVCEHAVRQEGTGLYIVTALLAIPAAALPLMLNSIVGLLIGSAFISYQRFHQRRGAALVGDP